MFANCFHCFIKYHSRFIKDKWGFCVRGPNKSRDWELFLSWKQDTDRQTDRQEMGLAFRSLIPLPECKCYTDAQAKSSRDCRPWEVPPWVPAKWPGSEDGPQTQLWKFAQGACDGSTRSILAVAKCWDLNLQLSLWMETNIFCTWKCWPLFLWSGMPKM